MKSCAVRKASFRALPSSRSLGNLQNVLYTEPTANTRVELPGVGVRCKKRLRPQSFSMLLGISVPDPWALGRSYVVSFLEAEILDRRVVSAFVHVASLLLLFL